MELGRRRVESEATRLKRLSHVRKVSHSFTEPNEMSVVKRVFKVERTMNEDRTAGKVSQVR